MYLLLFKHLRAIVGIFAYWTRFRCVQFFAVITEVHGELGEVGGDEWIEERRVAEYMDSNFLVSTPSRV